MSDNAHTRGYYVYLLSDTGNMKEIEKNEIKRLSDLLDAIRHQQAALSLVEGAEKYAELEVEKTKLETEIARLREVVRGLVVVHPMSALGREMGLQEMTGFAKSEF